MTKEIRAALLTANRHYAKANKDNRHPSQYMKGVRRSAMNSGGVPDLTIPGSQGQIDYEALGALQAAEEAKAAAAPPVDPHSSFTPQRMREMAPVPNMNQQFGLPQFTSEPQRNAQTNDAVELARQITSNQNKGELTQALGQTWPAQMAKSAYEGATAPGDALAGRLNPNSDEAIKRALDLAGLTAAGSTMGRAPAGAVRSGIARQEPVAAPARELNPIGLYSHGHEVAAALQQAKGTPEQFAAMLNKAGVKPQEFEAVGWQEAMAGKPSVTRDEVAALFRERGPQIEETVLPAGVAKYSEYTMPGSENYREVLLRTPPEEKVLNQWKVLRPDGLTDARFSSQEQAIERAQRIGGTISENFPINIKSGFKSSHWNEPNVLAHIRMADRTGPNGERLLHVEELQSDWAQKGRKEGFKTSATDRKNQNLVVTEKQTPTGNYWEVNTEQGQFVTNVTTPNVTREQALEIGRNRLAENDTIKIGRDNRVPTSPYVTNTNHWTDLALKRVIKEAVDGGYDRVVFTPGAEQAKRYSLSQNFERLSYAPQNRVLYAYEKDSPIPKAFEATEKELPNLIGREVAEKILNAKEIKGRQTIDGLALEMGGEGMKSFYDKIVPGRLKELTRKLDKDARIAPVAVQEGMPEMLSLQITPAMREAAKKGLPSFASGGKVRRSLQNPEKSELVRKALSLTANIGGDHGKR